MINRSLSVFEFAEEAMETKHKCSVLKPDLWIQETSSRPGLKRVWENADEVLDHKNTLCSMATGNKQAVSPS